MLQLFVSMTGMLANNSREITMRMKFSSQVADIIQPSDKCVFGSVKKAWNLQLVKFGKDRMGVGNWPFKKHDFVEVSSLVLTEAIAKQKILYLFSSTEIWQLNRARFPEAEFDPYQ